MSYQSEFADELRATMAKKQISQATVSRLTSLNNGTISRILSGKRKVSYDTIAKVAERLDMWKCLTPYELANKVDKLQTKLKYQRGFIVFVIGVLVCLLVK